MSFAPLRSAVLRFAPLRFAALAGGAFSNPRMSLKWAKAEKVSLLGEDLLSKG